MKPLSQAAAVASAITLLDQYLVEDGKRRTAGLNQYVEWLRLHQRHELADLICKNSHVAHSLQVLMEQHRA
jgi:hypothetical protein